MRALSWRSCRCSINCSEAEATKKKRGTDIGGGAWLVRFQGCNKIVNKIVDLTFLVVARVYFWTVDGAWNFYMFQEKPAAPVVYGVLSIARQIRRRPFELLSRADELSRNVSRLSFSRLLSPLPSIYFTSVSATILPSPYERPATLNAALIDGFFSNASSSLIYTSVPSLSSLSSLSSSFFRSISTNEEIFSAPFTDISGKFQLETWCNVNMVAPLIKLSQRCFKRFNFISRNVYLSPAILLSVIPLTNRRYTAAF